ARLKWVTRSSERCEVFSLKHKDATVNSSPMMPVSRLQVRRSKSDMLRKRAICCAILMAYSVCGGAAQKEARKEARRAPQKTETIACRLGTEDRHARIAVVLVGGKTDSFAYYSKWTPRPGSSYLQLNRAHLI